MVLADSFSNEFDNSRDVPIELWQAVGALNAATIIWGSQHAVIKDIVADTSPSSTNAARFVIAAVASLPWLPGGIHAGAQTLD